MIVFTIIGIIIVLVIIGSFLLGVAGIPIFQKKQLQIDETINNTFIEDENERGLALLLPKINESYVNYFLIKNELILTKDMSGLHDVVTSMYYYLAIKIMGTFLKDGNSKKYKRLRESLSIHKEQHDQEINLRCANIQARSYIRDEIDHDYMNRYLTSESVRSALDYEEYEAELVLKRYADETIPVVEPYTIYNEE